MKYRVDIILKDGTEEHFDTFISMDYAVYNINLAKISPDSIYRNEKYEGAQWIVNEEE